MIPEDGGRTSSTRPTPGTLATFAQFGASTYDPDPIYLGVTHSLITPPTSGHNDQVVVDASQVQVQGMVQINYSGLEQVTLNTGAGNDRVTVTPSLLTTLSVNAGDPVITTSPGDRVEFVLNGVGTPR